MARGDDPNVDFTEEGTLKIAETFAGLEGEFKRRLRG
jgi:hypothetical protein